MDHLTLLFEFIGTFLAGAIFFTKIVPEFKRYAVVLQVSFFMYTLLKEYLKRHPEKKSQLHILIAQMISHFLKTHPHGKTIAAQSDIDEKLESKLKHDSQVVGEG